jgi:hypothetical protein
MVDIEINGWERTECGTKLRKFCYTGRYAGKEVVISACDNHYGDFLVTVEDEVIFKGIGSPLEIILKENLGITDDVYLDSLMYTIENDGGRIEIDSEQEKMVEKFFKYGLYLNGCQAGVGFDTLQEFKDFVKNYSHQEKEIPKFNI